MVNDGLVGWVFRECGVIFFVELLLVGGDSWEVFEKVVFVLMVVLGERFGMLGSEGGLVLWFN